GEGGGGGSGQGGVGGGSAVGEGAVFAPHGLKAKKDKPPRYLAYVRAAQGQAKWADLGDAGIIDRAIDAWREALRNPNRSDVKRLARAVDEKVMRPVRALLGETRHLLIAPDGLLNLIPFAALVNEQNPYLIY